MRILILSLLASLGFSFASYSQSLDEVIEAGNESFGTKDYYNAFRCYETVLAYVAKGKYKGRWDPLYVKYRYAEAAQRFNYFEKADSVYSALLEESRGTNMDVFARSVFNLARVKQSLAEESPALNATRLNSARLSEAQALYERFLDENLRQHLKSFPASGKEEPGDLSPADKLSFDAAAEKGRIDCLQAIEAANANPGGAILEKDTLLRLSGKVNSKYSDIAPVVRENDLYFSSLQFPSKTNRFKHQSRIYAQVMKASYSRTTDGRLDTILAVDTLAQGGFFNDKNDFSHTLHTAIAQNGQWMYFSHCPQGRGGSFCTLYRRKNMGGTWGEPEYLDINVDSTRFTSTQPSISYDHRTKEQWLYFASDREGGKGQLDIWRCRVDEADGSLATPEPLSDINSAWNDATPFMHVLSGRLFFSSDRESTYGLYDNFVAKPNPAGRVVENLGLPYNSGYNDQYFFLADDGGQAFFSSDRPESTRFIDSLDACCQDIYTYPIDNTMEIEVSVTGCCRNLTEEADIKIYDITNCDCREGNLVEGNKVQRYHKYRIVATHKDFDEHSDTVALDWRSDGSFSEKITIDLPPRYVDLAFFARDSVSGRMLDFGTYSVSVTPHGGIQPEVLGDRAFRFDPKQNYTVEVKAHNPIYAPKTVMLDSIQIVCQCDSIIFVDLPVPCLPDSLKNIIFYFDNDKPNRLRNPNRRPIDLWPLTNDSFDEALLNPYLKQRKDYLDFNLRPITRDWDQIKDNVRTEGDRMSWIPGPGAQQGLLPKYWVERTAGGKARLTPDKFAMTELISSYFGNPETEPEEKGDLRENLEQFNNLKAYLKEYLATGNTAEITLQAFCSIRSDSTYNYHLAKRRILCIRNSLKDAGLGRYLDKTLIIKDVPFGSSQAATATSYPDPNVDLNRGDGGKLFYPAVFDRRVEVIDIKLGSCGTEAMGFSSTTKTKNPGQP